MSGDVYRAIETIEFSRQTHVEWRDWLNKNPNDPRTPAVGDSKHHQDCIVGYDNVLTILRSLKETHMPKNQLQLVQVMGDNTVIPMVTSALGEKEAAATMDTYPDAGYHFTYGNLQLVELTPLQTEEVFG